jgi:glycosyltransferase involved in cell wall biosynthesis
VTAFTAGMIYASDYGSISPGGIQSFIRAMGRSAPADIGIAYYGMGEPPADLLRSQDSFNGLMAGPPARGPVNFAFARELHKQRGRLAMASVLLLHRAEHQLAIPKSSRSLLTLHGGTNFAARAGISLFSVTYPLVEFLAVSRATSVLSVVADHHSALSRAAGAITPITTCYDDAIFKPSPQQPSERLITVSRLVPEKRLHLALDAAKTMAWPITIVGDGPEMSRLVARAKSQGVQATFTGMLSPRQISHLYSLQPGVFVMTSQFEGFPVSLLEAAGSGLPVVAIDAPGLRQAVTRLGGHLAKSPSELPAACTSGLRYGNSLSAGDVSTRFGVAAVAAEYWLTVRRLAS